MTNATVDRLKARREKHPAAELWQQNEMTEYLHYWGRRMASFLYDVGVRGRDEILNEVHETFKQAVPEITLDQSRRILSGLGRFHEVSKTAKNLMLKDYYAQLQLISKLDYMARGESRPPTGFERLIKPPSSAGFKSKSRKRRKNFQNNRLTPKKASNGNGSRRAKNRQPNR